MSVMGSEGTQPDFASVQAHYDRPQGLYFLFLDQRVRILPNEQGWQTFRVPTYSCAYFENDQTSLEDAQQAKIDLSLEKLNLQKGQRLLDIGFGWGSVAFRAHDEYGAAVSGLTLSRNQHEHVQAVASEDEGLNFLLEGWETHQGEYDAIISIGAFEHFGRDNYPAFFKKAWELLIPGGKMLLHTITFGKPPTSLRFARYGRFIDKEIFPNGQLPYPEQVMEESRKANFELLTVQALREHYAKTLQVWLANLQTNEEAAIAVTSRETVDIYKKYLGESAGWFDSGEISVMQFLLQKPS